MLCQRIIDITRYIWYNTGLAMVSLKLLCVQCTYLLKSDNRKQNADLNTDGIDESDGTRSIHISQHRNTGKIIYLYAIDVQ